MHMAENIRAKAAGSLWGSQSWLPPAFSQRLEFLHFQPSSKPTGSASGLAGSAGGLAAGVLLVVCGKQNSEYALDRGAANPGQCHLVFAKSGIRHNWRADPLVRAGRPRPALLSKNQALATVDNPARGPAADEGVRPTIYAGGGIGITKWHWVRLRAPHCGRPQTAYSAQSP
jgi:hypothetical protein